VGKAAGVVACIVAFALGVFVAKEYFPRVVTPPPRIVEKVQPGETKVVEVPTPVYIPRVVTVTERVPVFVPERIPVVVTRTEHKIETVTKPITLPPEKIREVVERSPQSIEVKMTALRDIKKGEEFSLVATKVDEGIYQAILPEGSPITAEVKTTTQLPEISLPKRDWSVRISPTIRAISLGSQMAVAVGVEAVAERGNWIFQAAGGTSTAGGWWELGISYRF